MSPGSVKGKPVKVNHVVLLRANRCFELIQHVVVVIHMPHIDRECHIRKFKIVKTKSGIVIDRFSIRSSGNRRRIVIQ